MIIGVYIYCIYIYIYTYIYMCIYVINYNYIDIFIHTGLFRTSQSKTSKQFVGTAVGAKGQHWGLEGTGLDIAGSTKKPRSLLSSSPRQMVFFDPGVQGCLTQGSHKGSYCQRCLTF